MWPSNRRPCCRGNIVDVRQCRVHVVRLLDDKIQNGVQRVQIGQNRRPRSRGDFRGSREALFGFVAHALERVLRVVSGVVERGAERRPQKSAAARCVNQTRGSSIGRPFTSHTRRARVSDERLVFTSRMNKPRVEKMSKNRLSTVSTNRLRATA